MHLHPQLVGILNITPDSFSDGGSYVGKKHALRQAQSLIEQGADIIDIGAESTRAGAKPLTDSEEWERLEPVLAEIIQCCHNNDVKVSLDSFHPENVAKALELGIDMANDQSGGENPEMVAVLKQSNIPVVIMHHLGIPTDKLVTLSTECDPVEEIINWAKERCIKLEKQGIDRSRLIVDPGIGFGKTAEQSLEILRRAEEFQLLQLPLYIGHSRKSFLETMTNAPAKERDIETVVASLFLAAKGVEYLRVHNVEIHQRALAVSSCF